MYSLGWNDFAGHGVVGLVWGAWHIPYYLFFLDRAVLEAFTTLPVAAFIVLAILVMVAWAIVYGERFSLTGSIWPAVLMHSVEDAGRCHRNIARSVPPRARIRRASSAPISRMRMFRQRISPPCVWSEIGPRAGTGCFRS